MHQNMINRIAGMLSRAVTQDSRRVEASLAMIKRYHTMQHPDMSKRIGNRPGNAADKFKTVVQQNQAIRDKYHSIKNQWLDDSESVLFDE
jgi:hypothetical protein